MIVYILNLIDLAFTLHALRHGAVELNPLMQDIPTMIIYKAFVVGALLLLLEHFRENTKMVKWGLWSITAAFATVNLWHVVNIFIFAQ